MEHPVKRSTRRVVAAFRQGRPRMNSESIWTDGHVIYSFGVIIAARQGAYGVVVSPPAATFGRVTRQRIAELLALLPKATIAGRPL